MNKKTIFALVAVLGLTLGLWGYIQANVGEVTLCVRRGGLVFIRDECRRGETEITLNSKGEQGEQGEKGETGEKGDKGNDGTDGQDGTELHLFDGDNQDLGIVVRAEIGGSWTTYLEDEDVLVEFSQGGSTAGLNIPAKAILFTELNCTGTTFISGGTPQVLYRDDAGSFFLKPLPGVTAIRNKKSFRDGSNICKNSFQSLTNTRLFSVVTLPFSVSTAVPHALTPSLIVKPI